MDFVDFVYQSPWDKPSLPLCYSIAFGAFRSLTSDVQILRFIIFRTMTRHSGQFSALLFFWSRYRVQVLCYSIAPDIQGQ